ncbi:hypothetical protein HDU93_000268 [Gonapodya sp. JEL0774]|nr:hypothetical protein HDU93_000268 [Gonapodya sp. JEL0774]
MAESSELLQSGLPSWLAEAQVEYGFYFALDDAMSDEVDVLDQEAPFSSVAPQVMSLDSNNDLTSAFELQLSPSSFSESDEVPVQSPEGDVIGRESFALECEEWAMLELEEQCRNAGLTAQPASSSGDRSVVEHEAQCELQSADWLSALLADEFLSIPSPVAATFHPASEIAPPMEDTAPSVQMEGIEVPDSVAPHSDYPTPAASADERTSPEPQPRGVAMHEISPEPPSPAPEPIPEPVTMRRLPSPRVAASGRSPSPRISPAPSSSTPDSPTGRSPSPDSSFESQSVTSPADLAKAVIDAYVHSIKPTGTAGTGTRGKNTFACRFPGCGHVFSRRYNCVTHVKTHLDLREHRCQERCSNGTQCTLMFARLHDLRRHVAAVHHFGKQPWCICVKCEMAGVAPVTPSGRARGRGRGPQAAAGGGAIRPERKARVAMAVQEKREDLMEELSDLSDGEWGPDSWGLRGYGHCVEKTSTYI